MINKLRNKKAIGVIILNTSQRDIEKYNASKHSIYEVIEIDTKKERVYYALCHGERHGIQYTKIRQDEQGKYILIHRNKCYLADMIGGLTWHKSTNNKTIA